MLNRKKKYHGNKITIRPTHPLWNRVLVAIGPHAVPVHGPYPPHTHMGTGTTCTVAHNLYSQYHKYALTRDSNSHHLRNGLTETRLSIGFPAHCCLGDGLCHAQVDRAHYYSNWTFLRVLNFVKSNMHGSTGPTSTHLYESSSSCLPF